MGFQPRIPADPNSDRITHTGFYEEKSDRDEIMIGIYRNSNWNYENLNIKNMVKNQKPTMFIVDDELKQTTINLK